MMMLSPAFTSFLLTAPKDFANSFTHGNMFSIKWNDGV